jgi:hypothetical protein
MQRLAFLDERNQYRSQFVGSVWGTWSYGRVLGPDLAGFGWFFEIHRCWRVACDWGWSRAVRTAGNQLCLPFFRVASRPDDRQILYGKTDIADIKVLRHDDEPGLGRLLSNCEGRRRGFVVMRNQDLPGIGYTDDARRVGVFEIDGRLAASQAENDLMIEVCFGLKAASCAGTARAFLGGFQLGIKRWMLTPGLVSHARELGPSGLQIGVDGVPIRQVKCDSPEDLLQGEGRERFGDAFGRFTPQEGVCDGVKGDSGADNAVSAIALFDVVRRHIASIISIGRPEVAPQTARVRPRRKRRIGRR